MPGSLVKEIFAAFLPLLLALVLWLVCLWLPSFWANALSVVAQLSLMFCLPMGTLAIQNLMAPLGRRHGRDFFFAMNVLAVAIYFCASVVTCPLLLKGLYGALDHGWQPPWLLQPWRPCRRRPISAAQRFSTRHSWTV